MLIFALTLGQMVKMENYTKEMPTSASSAGLSSPAGYLVDEVTQLQIWTLGFSQHILRKRDRIETDRSSERP